MKDFTPAVLRFSLGEQEFTSLVCFDRRQDSVDTPRISLQLNPCVHNCPACVIPRLLVRWDRVVCMDHHAPSLIDSRTLAPRAPLTPHFHQYPNMSTSPNALEHSSAPRSVPSPRSHSLQRAEDPPDDALPEQRQPADALEVEVHDDDDMPYPEPSSEQPLLPPPNFRPFFTLIEDTTSGEHYHPYVHYVFADDDPTILTAASMRGLGLDDASYLPQDAQPGGERQRTEGSEQGDELDSPVESPFPPPIPGVKEHYLIVDVGADGRTIMDAQSLSSEWQITDTAVRIAPSFDEGSPDQGYMLRIEGVKIPKKNKGKGKGQAGLNKLDEARDKQGDIFAALDELVHGIEEDLYVAGKMAGVRRREGDDGTVADVCEDEVEKTVGDER